MPTRSRVPPSRLSTSASLLALARVAALLAPAALAGCGLLKSASQAPGKIADALTPGEEPMKVDTTVLTQRLMRFADLLALETKIAADEFAARAGTPAARMQALEWRIDYANAAWKRATVPQPYAGLFDMIVLVTGIRAAHEERWLAEWGEPDRVVLEAFQRLEAEVWKLAGEGLTSRQLDETRAIVAEWLKGDPRARIADVAHLPGFGDLTRDEGEADGGLVGELTQLVSLDPLAGLEPAAREVERTRALAERFLYYVQRLPELVEVRLELLALRSSESQPTRTALEGWERASRSFETIAATADELPAKLGAEREAAVAQVSAELERQRAGLVSDLETAREPLVQLLGETRATAEAGRAMSVEVAEALRTLGTFLDRFEKDETAAPEPVDPAKKPFDVTEYGAAAERVGVAVRELNATVGALDQSLPSLERALDEAAERGERTVDHAWRRALQLVGITLVGIAATVLLVRWMSPRVRRA